MKKNYMRRENSRKKLLDAANNRCPVCGRENVPLELDHIVPVSKGGSYGIENLRVICSYCNRRIGNSPYSELEFNLYLKRLMDDSSRYKRVDMETVLPGKTKYRADITAEENSGVTILIECKNRSVIMRNGIMNAISQINEYRLNSHYNKYIIAFPGRVSAGFKTLFSEARIIVWDADYISKTFYSEIYNSNHPYFRDLFLSLVPLEQQPIWHRLIEQLRSCEPGRGNWPSYQKLVGQIFENLFCPPLESPILESSDNCRANRRDLVFPNYADSGFWHFMRQTYMADFVVVEAKNYTKPISKAQVLQTSNYIKPHGAGMFAIITTRSGANTGALQTIREHWMTHKKMILTLDDDDLDGMLRAASSGGDPSRVIGQALQEFRLSI
ncbi:MAG: HNH endonuclease [Candidatus Sabulitectum sp.]|nr:HNH endonuclease [Candidatus Sabulitectum sp.]